MDTDRQNNYTGYLGYLSSCGATYRKIGLAAKYVLIFLEKADEISRRGYRRYKQAHASELSTMPGATDAILDFLSFIGVGYSRAKRKVKSLEKKEDICARNEKKVNEFIEWLDTESDASERTRETYRFAIRSFFSYADEFNQENVKRFLKTLEEQKMKPATINNRMCALVKYSKFAKKPISVKKGKRCNLQQDFQFFATPPEVADWLVSLAGNFSPDCKVLEPSAGTGAIIDAIHRVQPDVVVDCYELMPENKEKLSKLDHIRLLGDDFTQAEHPSGYDLIVANPPFSKNQDIRHVMQMYHDLKPGGTVAAITSRHWQQASEKVCKDFRAFLEEVSAQVYEIEEGAFKKSGTGVGTIAIVINKRDGK